MFDKFMERLMESAASTYMPRIEEIAEERRRELFEMKSRVRSEPEAVEAWFDLELEKVGKIDPKDLFSKLA